MLRSINSYRMSLLWTSSTINADNNYLSFTLLDVLTIPTISFKYYYRSYPYLFRVFPLSTLSSTYFVRFMHEAVKMA